jgi:hypothetical protein
MKGRSITNNVFLAIEAMD